MQEIFNKAVLMNTEFWKHVWMLTMAVV